ncbi:hypothetical protein GHT91_03425 [Acinetobacter baumannii]|nr:hypothetical protein [Acinetobacter baumannii]
MNYLFKFLLIVPVLLPITSLFAKADNTKYHAVAAFITGKVYSCEYKITYTNYEKQKIFENEKVAYKNLPFIYTKLLHSVYHRETYSRDKLPTSLKTDMENGSTAQAPRELSIKVDFDVKMDKRAYNIRLTPSTGSESLDHSIKNAFSSAKFDTKKKFWWGDTLAFSDEIRLEKVDSCQVRNLH